MPAFSDFLENSFLDFIFNATPMTPPATVYLSLHDAAGASESTAAWSATELSTGAGDVNYARAAASPAAWTAASSGSVNNSSDITFATAGSTWGAVTHVGIWDAASGGNLLFYGALSASRTINNGDAARFAAGNLVVILT